MNIIFYSRPHLGCTHDVQLFNKNHPTISVKKILADIAYCGNIARNVGIVAPHKRSVNIDCTREQIVFNTMHYFCPSKVEHIIVS